MTASTKREGGASAPVALAPRCLTSPQELRLIAPAGHCSDPEGVVKLRGETTAGGPRLEEDNPSLACESCGASISLTRVRRHEESIRSIECGECDYVMTWSLAG